MTMQHITSQRRYNEFVRSLKEETTVGIETETSDNGDGTLTRSVYCGGTLEARRTFKVSPNPERETNLKLEVNDESDWGKWACAQDHRTA